MSEELELRIQKSAEKKDKNFVLSGQWKVSVREQDGFKIYSVDTEWVKNNLEVDFEHAGHGFVHEFIPLDEIWIGTSHHEGCKCKNVRPDRKISRGYFESTVIHEIIEFKIMALGIPYKAAHKIALWVETKVKILKDPYTEEYAEEDD